MRHAHTGTSFRADTNNLRAKASSPRSEVETSIPFLSKVLIGQNKQRAKKSPLFTASALEHRLVRGAEENLLSSYLNSQKLGTERDRDLEDIYTYIGN